MVFAPTLLLFTTIASVGLIAAWAAASQRHWLSRVMLFLGVAALPLLIPAHELSIAFVTLGATIAAGIGVWKWLRRRAAGESRASRFSTRDLLLTVIPVAAVCAVVVRMPPLGVDRWVGMLTSGVVGGLVFLVGLWLVAGVPWNRWVRVTLAALTGLAALLIARAWGELLASLTYQAGWPIESLIAWERQDIVSRLPWIGIAVAAILLAACAAWAWRPWSNTKRQRAISTFAYGMLAAVVLAPPMLALYLLDNPTPLPRHEVPVPNGIDDFDQARRLLLIPLGVKTEDDADTGIASQEEIDTMLRRQERVAELVKQGLTKDVRLWIAHSREPSTQMFAEHLAKVGDYKAVARSLDSYAGSLASQDLPAEAALEYATLAQYGASLSRGGLLVDAMVAAACGGQGAEGLYSVRKSTPPEAYATILKAISEADERADDFDSIILRELILSQRMGGWSGRLVGILGVTAELQRPAFESSRVSYQQFIAALRLLQLEYALLIYRDLHGAWPNELRQLTPGILESLPADPFADDGAAFRYQRQGDGYQLYSVWADGADDHGEPPRETNGQISWNPDLSGDLSLGALYDVE